jgi:divalent metal cation (Fe/Co/Zn/Cd) transporter
MLFSVLVPGEMTKEHEDLLHKREKRASMAISFILILLGIGVVITSAHDLSSGPETAYDLKLVLAIAFFSIFIFGTMTVVKFRFAHKLSSASLYKDGICSLIGTSLAASLFANTLIIKVAPSVW